MKTLANLLILFAAINSGCMKNQEVSFDAVLENDRGQQLLFLTNDQIINSLGQSIAYFEGSEMKNSIGQLLARIDGENIYNSREQIIGVVEGHQLINLQGQAIMHVSGLKQEDRMKVAAYFFFLE